jgi:hypothetical protein
MSGDTGWFERQDNETRAAWRRRLKRVVRGERNLSMAKKKAPTKKRPKPMTDRGGRVKKKPGKGGTDSC